MTKSASIPVTHKLSVMRSLPYNVIYPKYYKHSNESCTFIHAKFVESSNWVLEYVLHSRLTSELHENSFGMSILSLPIACRNEN